MAVKRVTNIYVNNKYICIYKFFIESSCDVSIKWDFHNSLNTVTIQWQIQSKYNLHQDSPFNN